jgi:hypothetical protein
VRAQIQSGIIFGASAALDAKITLEDGSRDAVDANALKQPA